MTLHCTTLPHAKPCFATLCNTIAYHTMPCHTMPHNTTPCHLTLHHTIPLRNTHHHTEPRHPIQYRTRRYNYPAVCHAIPHVAPRQDTHAWCLTSFCSGQRSWAETWTILPWNPGAMEHANSDLSLHSHALMCKYRLIA